MGRTVPAALLLLCALLGLAGLASAQNCPTSSGINTVVTESGGNRVVTPTGCPYHNPADTTPNTATTLTVTYTFPVTPTLAASKTYDISITNADGSANSAGGVKGAIGLSLDGVALFGDADANNLDAYVSEGKTFNQCTGHAQNQGVYHYHSQPPAGCVTCNTTGKHSPMAGLMADGIPIFGSLGDNGIAPTNLDTCGGHTDSSYPYYHYHFPAETKPPYTVRCLMGCLAADFGNLKKQACTAAANQPNWSSMSVTWLTNAAVASACSAQTATPSPSPPPPASTGIVVTASPPPPASTATPSPPPPPPTTRATQVRSVTMPIVFTSSATAQKIVNDRTSAEYLSFKTLTEASMTVLARRTVSGATATLTRLTFRARRSLLQTGTIDTAYSITVPSSTSTEANTLAAAMVTTINSASSTGGSVSSIFPTSTLSSLGISGVGTASTTACTVAVCGAAAAAAGLSALIGAVLLAAVL